jgi:hypothetical protein
MNEIKMMSGSGGSRLYVGAHTFKTSDGTLNADTRSIYIREDQAAMITSMKVNGVALSAIADGKGIIGAALKANDFFTFDAEITEIVCAGGSFIGYEVVGEE